MTAPEEEYRTIPLTKEQSALVDVADYEWINQWKWYAKWSPSTKSFYAARSSEHIRPEHQRTIRMHREILGLAFGDHRKVDHENHNTLDNRRRNIRLASDSQNACNRLCKIGQHGVRGVRLQKNGAWQAQIMVNRKKMGLGTYPTKQKAAQAYLEAVRRLHGKFARPQ